MKNLIFVFIAVVCLVLISCSKENLDLPSTEKVESISTKKASIQSSNTMPSITISSDVVEMEKPVTIKLQVSEVTSFQSATEYFVEFSGNYDFASVNLVSAQTLRFVDDSGNVSTLAFDVNDFIGSNGKLEVDFAKGGNNLMGLTLMVAQEIIIDDNIMN